MPKLVGIIGLLIVCAGLDLLWQSRHEIRFWLLAYTKLLRALLLRQDSPLRGFPAGESSEKRRGAVRVALGMSLACFLGPILIAISLTLMLYYNL